MTPQERAPPPQVATMARLSAVVLALAAPANALVAPSAPAASTVVRQGVIQTPPILTREDGLETRPMAADMPGIGQCINQPVSRVPEAGR